MAMRPLLSLVAVGVLSLCSACTHTSALEVSDPALRADVNERAEGRTARVTLVSGERTRARALHLAAGVATWVDPSTGEVRSVPSADVVRVRFLSRGKGAAEGAGIGLTVASALGGVALIASGNDEFLSPTAAGLLVGALAAIHSVPLGALIGTVRGSHTVYEVGPEEEQR